jgi:hypothetical protein
MSGILDFKQEFKTNNLKACDKTRSRKASFFERSYTVSAFFGKFQEFRKFGGSKIETLA